LYVEKQQLEKWNKTKLEIVDLFKEKNYLFNHWVLGNTHHNLTLGGELRHLDLMMNSVKERAIDIDSTLGPWWPRKHSHEEGHGESGAQDAESRKNAFTKKSLDKLKR